MRLPRIVASVAVVAAVCTTASAEDSRLYAEGPVVEFTYMKIKPGTLDSYMKLLDSEYKTLMEEEKKEGLILDYTIYRARPRAPSEPDLITVVRYKSLAALETRDAHLGALLQKLFPMKDAARQKLELDLDQTREILGTELFRELELK